MSDDELKVTTKQFVVVRVLEEYDWDDEYIVITKSWLHSKKFCWFPKNTDDFEDLEELGLKYDLVKEKDMFKLAIKIQCYTGEYILYYCLICNVKSNFCVELFKARRRAASKESRHF